MEHSLIRFDGYHRNAHSGWCDQHNLWGWSLHQKVLAARWSWWSIDDSFWFHEHRWKQLVDDEDEKRSWFDGYSSHSKLGVIECESSWNQWKRNGMEYGDRSA